MLRRIALASFALAIAFVVACGHEVTPEPTSNNLSGKIQIRFRTVGAMNLSLYTYGIILNTCGEGPPYAPEPNVYGTSFNNYSFGFFIGGNYGATVPLLYQYILNPGSSNQLDPQSVIPPPSDTNFIPNSDGSGNEFEYTFTRALLANPLGVAQPCPNIATATPTPSPAAGASTTASPTASPTAVPSGATAAPSASPTATPSPFSAPTTQAQATWYLNFFTIDNAKGVVVDTLGPNGANDNSYSGVIVNTQMPKSLTLSKPVGGPEPSDTAAQIQGGEVDNYL